MVKNYIFLGAPGVGKGTLAKKISGSKNLVHISSGDIFRKNIKEETEIGIEAKKYIDKGLYVPDNVTNEMVRRRLEQDDVKTNGCILDGYPRTVAQAEFLEQLPEFKITSAVLLDTDDETVKKRLAHRAKVEKRSDDSPEIISKRIKVYHNKTKPLID